MDAKEYNLWAARRIFDRSKLPSAWIGRSRDPGSDDFVEAVSSFQKDHTVLATDGKLGPKTLIMLQAFFAKEEKHPAILLSDRMIDFPGKVIQKRGLATGPRDHNKILRGIIHVDMAWTSEKCFAILKKRKLSTHFGVDGDVGEEGFSTLYQFADPGLRFCYHAGKANKTSIGVDVNTPLDLKYQEDDRKLRSRSRPVIQAVVRGKERTNLGLFPEQLNTLKALIEILDQTFEIPLFWPRGIPSSEFPGGKPVYEIWDQWLSFYGWMGHCHLPFTDHYCPGSVGKQIVESIFI